MTPLPLTATLTRKRKKADDVYTRVAATSTPSNTSGRGAVSGWTTCPLCDPPLDATTFRQLQQRQQQRLRQEKRYALGRGIAAHLHAVHAPWKPPGKKERLKRRRLADRQREEAKRRAGDINNDDKSVVSTELNESDREIPSDFQAREPTPQEQEEWAQRVLEIVSELEAEAQKRNGVVGMDRTGRRAQTYRQSLPPLLQAAADGNLEQIQALCNATEGRFNDDSKELQALLQTRDRNGSTAEHWAAGGGHLDSLKYLLQLRKKYIVVETTKEDAANKRIRRRDGKTCLHYAARNGHVPCAKYLLNEGHNTVDERSGDGTTPLHLAVFGGHVEMVSFLLMQGADVHATNDWDCGCAHWMGMSKCKYDDVARRVCRMLQQAGVSFTVPQKQGHCALHKACQRQNRAIVQWMADASKDGGAGLSEDEIKRAGLPDDGGHKPSDIWRSVGGDEDFANWMLSKFSW